MMTYERAMRNGRWLSRRKKWLPYVFVLSFVVALVISTPFSIVYDNLFFAIVSFLSVVLGFGLRFMAMRTPAFSVEEMIEARGIYSVIRFPRYAANILIVLGLTLYTGVGWYFVLVALLCFLFTERILLSEENALVNRCGELYIQWSKHTNAIVPRLIDWKASTCKKGWWKLLLSQSRQLFAVSVGFCLIDLLKNWRVEFSFRVGFCWLVLLGLTIIVQLFARVARK